MSTLARPTRAIVFEAFGGPDVLRLTERQTPAPGPGEVLIDVEVAGVNFGDTMIRRGEYMRDQRVSSIAPGAEVIGKIAATGEGTTLALGTRVAGWLEAGGGYADRVIAPAHRTYPVPDDLPAAAIAAVFLQGTTSYYAVNRFGATAPGETVLVHGAAGGVGGLAVQLARVAGARVVATASSDAKRAIARDHGAELALDSRSPETLAERVREFTGGRGCDVVVDGVGGALFEPSMRALANDGRYVVAGAASQQPAMLDVRKLMVRNQWVCGFILARITEVDAAEPLRALTALCDLIRDGRLRPVYATVPLQDAAEAHRRIETRDLVGKLVLAVQS
jgi:NADPH2:quinone reductase